MKITSVRFSLRGFCTFCVVLISSTVLASPLVVAHRGYSSIYPENTIPAVTAAEPYAWGCEIDIRRTADGQYVLMHDRDVSRTTNGGGYVDQLSFSYIRSLDAGSWKASAFAGTQVPTVVETINAAVANDLKLCVEIKADSVVASELVSLLTPYRNNIEVHSFDEGLLQDMADLGGDFTYVLIGSGSSLGSKIYNLEPCIDKVSWYNSNINSTIVNAVHAMDKEIYAWTVNNAATATNLANMGVDVILTDQPALIDYTLNGGPATTVPHRLKDGLLAHWAFDEGLTNPYTRTAADSSGNGNDATLTTSVSIPGAWKTGSSAKVGGAIDLDGYNDTTEIITGSELVSPVPGMTFSTWIKLDELPSAMSSAYGSIYDSSADAYVLYLNRGTSELRMKVSANTAAYVGIPQSMLDTTNWHHVVGVYDGAGGSAQIYLDGQLVDIDSGSSGMLSGLLGSQLPTIGSSVSSNFFDGRLDEMSVWNRALGQAEIEYLYNSGQGRSMPSENVHVGAPTPVVRYRFERTLVNSGSGGSAYNGIAINGLGSLGFGETGVEGDYAIRATNSHVSTNGDYVNTSYQLTDTGTIAFWCKANEFYNYNTIFDTAGDSEDWEMWINSTGEARFRIDYDSYVSCTLDDADEWYHITLGWTNVNGQANLRCFLNGELVATDQGNWTSPGSPLYLFGGNSGNIYGNCSLDDFRIYDALLTGDEVMAIFLQQEESLIPGDANGDGFVDGSDATILANYWQYGVGMTNPDATWAMGDFNGDHVVDGSDATLLASHWQEGTPPSSAVPEPSTGVLLIFTTFLMWFIRKYR